MEYDYYRKEITDVIEAGPQKDEDFFRVKVFGKTDSKHLNVTADQLRTLADAMDETNPPSLLPMHNGARVIRADVEDRVEGTAHGYAIAHLTSEESGHEYVVWAVSRRRNDCRWYADNGDYRSTIERATERFNERRGVTV